MELPQIHLLLRNAYIFSVDHTLTHHILKPLSNNTGLSEKSDQLPAHFPQISHFPHTGRQVQVQCGNQYHQYQFDVERQKMM